MEAIVFCIDFRSLNKIVIFDPEPIPNPQVLYSSMSAGEFFTKLDLSKGYWQIPVDKNDQEKTSFLTPDGLYHFKFMPFGLVTASAVFTKMMRIVLNGVENVVNYIDDIVIYTKDFDSHIKTFDIVLERLRRANLSVRPTKCMVGFHSIELLGHEIGKGVIKTNLKLAEKVIAAPRPVTKKQVRSFLGLTGFYRDFIPNYSDIALPLTELTRKGSSEKVKWGEQREEAFLKLKQCLVNPPILHLPDPDRLFILKFDASENGIGCPLMQRYDNHEFPVAYASKKLLPREKNYSVIEKECLAIVWSIKKFDFYLYGRMCEVHTDHKPLVYINAKKTINKRIMRWSMMLQEYRFRLVAIPGKDNAAVDYLSRSDQD